MQHLTDDQLLDWIDGLVTEEETLAYATHLTGCDDCQSRHQAFVAMHNQLQTMPLLQPSVVFTERVLDQWDDIRLAVAVKKKQTRKTPFVFLAMMGALVLSCFLILYFVSAPAPLQLPVADTVQTLGKVMGNGTLWTGLLSVNALLLLWLVNRRILQPFFRQRMAL